MNEEALNKITAIRNKIKEISDEDISHDDLGVASGFHDAEESKTKIILCVHEKLEAIEHYIDSLNENILLATLNNITAVIDKLIVLTTRVKNLVQQGTEVPQYKNERMSINIAFKDQEAALNKGIYAIEIELKINELSEDIQNKEQIKKLFYEVEKLKKDVISIQESKHAKIH